MRSAGRRLRPVVFGPSGFFSDPFLKRKVESMRLFTQALVNFVKREDGPTAVEYAVMLALIIVVCITAISTLGSNANSTFNKVASTVGS
jgi:pilus assembly protein Flp/PilA